VGRRIAIGHDRVYGRRVPLRRLAALIVLPVMLVGCDSTSRSQSHASPERPSSTRATTTVPNGAATPAISGSPSPARPRQFGSPGTDRYLAYQYVKALGILCQSEAARRTYCSSPHGLQPVLPRSN
jgi:hypothetical protein